jgi:hypothetical protein
MPKTLVNLPINAEKLLARFACSGQERDGFTHVLSTPNRPNGIDLDGWGRSS